MKIKNILFSALGIVACAFLATSCSQNEDMADDTVATNGKLTFKLNDGGMKSTGLTSRATIDETTMTTTFEVGDKAGIFAVKNGQIANNFNNICVTYNANGFWDAPESIAYSSDMDGMQFYAYYPYNEAIAFDPAQADPFATAKSQTTLPADQSTKEKFNSADLMTSGATTIDAKFHAVTANLTHVFALAKINMPNVSYTFDNANFTSDQKTYVIAQAKNVGFTLGSTDVNPYFDNSQQSYYLLVNPNTTDELTVKFVNNGHDRTLNITDLNKVGVSQYAKYNVDGGVNLIKHTLAIGDFYTENGYIFSSDFEGLRNDGTIANPYINAIEKIVGVVYSLGTGEEVSNSNAAWIHGQVIALHEGKLSTGNANWSTYDFTKNLTSEDWFSKYGLQNAGSSSFKKFENITNQNETGYSQTTAWKACYAENPTYCDEAINQLNTCQTDYPAPSGITTGWYIPGNWDWKIICDGINASGTPVVKSIAAAGGDAYNKSTVYYPSDGGLKSGTSYTYRMYRFQESGSNQFAHLGSPASKSAKYRFILGF